MCVNSILLWPHSNSSATLSVFRTLRVMRTFKLLKRWDSLQQLMFAVFQSGPGLGYFSLILFLYLFVCSLLGMSLFAGRLDPDDEVFGSRANFDSLFFSFVTTFQLVTGENWDSVLYRTMNYSPVMGALFCVFVYVSGSLVVLNILLAILLENFSEKKEGSVSYYDRLERQDASSFVWVAMEYVRDGVEVVKKRWSRWRKGELELGDRGVRQEGGERGSNSETPLSLATKRRSSVFLNKRAEEVRPSGRWDGKRIYIICISVRSKLLVSSRSHSCIHIH